MNNAERIKKIKTLLEQEFKPIELKIIDDSDKHIGHQSAQGAGHFSVLIKSHAFQGLNRISRHQAVFSCLQTLMKTEIHALSLKTLSPDEK